MKMLDWVLVIGLRALAIAFVTQAGLVGIVPAAFAWTLANRLERLAEHDLKAAADASVNVQERK